MSNNLAKRVYSLVVNIKENPDCGERIPHLKWLDEAVWQKELAESGYRHWQCYLHFCKPVRGLSIVRELGVKGTYQFMEIIGKANDSKKLAIIKMRQYCQKEESRIEGPWTFGIKEKHILEITMPERFKNHKMKTFLRKKYIEICSRQYYLDHGTLPDVTVINDEK